jgi:hypothetical protein
MGQESNKGYWAYAKVRKNYKKGECRTVFMTNVFKLSDANENTIQKYKYFVGEEFGNSLLNNGFEESALKNITISAYDSEKKANEVWQQNFERATQDAIRNDFNEYCTPVNFEWTFTGERYKTDSNYSIFEDGWIVLKDSLKNNELAYLKDAYSSENLIDNKKISVRERKLSFFKKGRLVEYTINKGKENAILLNRLYANDTAFFVGKQRRFLEKLKFQRPYLYNDEDVLSYLQFAVNFMEAEGGHRVTILTRRRLAKENFELRRQALNWDFELKDPEVIYSDRKNSLVRVFAYIKGTLNLAIFKVDNTNGEIDLEDHHTIRTLVEYNSGKSVGAGILIKNNNLN